MSDSQTFIERWNDDLQRVVGQAFAEAVERDDLQVADRWLASLMLDPPTPAEMQEQDA